MQKDFDRWNENKKLIDSKTSLMYHERELWWCSLGLNVGFEQNGSSLEFRRPVLVLKGLSRSTCIIIPVTTSKNTHKYRIPLGLVGDKQSVAIISQLRIIDTRRLVKKIGTIDRILFSEIRKTAKAML